MRHLKSTPTFHRVDSLDEVPFACRGTILLGQLRVGEITSGLVTDAALSCHLSLSSARCISCQHQARTCPFDHLTTDYRHHCHHTLFKVQSC